MSTELEISNQDPTQFVSATPFFPNKPGKVIWTTEEDAILKQMVELKGTGSWTLIAAALPERSGKQCRERWHNHLEQGIKKGDWSQTEDKIILSMQKVIGNQWAKITKLLPGRTDNSVKNRYHVAARAHALNKDADQFETIPEDVLSVARQVNDPEIQQAIDKYCGEATTNHSATPSSCSASSSSSSSSMNPSPFMLDQKQKAHEMGAVLCSSGAASVMSAMQQPMAPHPDYSMAATEAQFNQQWLMTVQQQQHQHVAAVALNMRGDPVQCQPPQSHVNVAYPVAQYHGAIPEGSAATDDYDSELYDDGDDDASEGPAANDEDSLMMDLDLLSFDGDNDFLDEHDEQGNIIGAPAAPTWAEKATSACLDIDPCCFSNFDWGFLSKEKAPQQQHRQYQLPSQQQQQQQQVYTAQQPFQPQAAAYQNPMQQQAAQDQQQAFYAQQHQQQQQQFYQQQQHAAFLARQQQLYRQQVDSASAAHPPPQQQQQQQSNWWSAFRR